VWLARQQANQIEHRKTANRAPLERLGKQRLRFTLGDHPKPAIHDHLKTGHMK
jgi:hypothetical protein